jgi:flagellar basal body P-ring formation protein FlgA
MGIMNRLFLVLVSLLAVPLPFASNVAAQQAGRATSAVMLPVPRITIYPGQVVTGDMLEWRQWNAADPRLEAAARRIDQVAGQVARRTLVPRYPIALAELRQAAALEQGQVVTIVFRGHAITILGKGVMLQQGAVGSSVRVRNVDSARVVVGRVTEDGSVVVGGGS